MMTQDANTISMRLSLDDARTMFPKVMNSFQHGGNIAAVQMINGVEFACYSITGQRGSDTLGESSDQWFVTLQFQRLFPIVSIYPPTLSYSEERAARDFFGDKNVETAIGSDLDAIASERGVNPRRFSGQHGESDSMFRARIIAESKDA